MKLIVDIDKDYFEILKYEERNGNDFKPIKLIANGTPLEEELFNIENELFKNLKYSDYVESEYVLTKDIEKVLKAH